MIPNISILFSMGLTVKFYNECTVYSIVECEYVNKNRQAIGRSLSIDASGAGFMHLSIEISNKIRDSVIFYAKIRIRFSQIKSVFNTHN